MVCCARNASFVYEKCAQRGHSCSQEILHKCDLKLYMHIVNVWSHRPLHLILSKKNINRLCMFCSWNHIIGRAVTGGGAMMYGTGGIDTAFTAKLSCLVTYLLC